MTPKTPLTEQEMRRLLDLPVAVINIRDLPHPPSEEFDPTPGELRANTAALRRILHARMTEDPGLKPLKNFTAQDLRGALCESVPSCLRITTNRPLAESALDEAPSTALDGPWRMDGLMRPKAAFMLVRDHPDARNLVGSQLGMPEALVEKSWPQYKTDLHNLILLHELTHAAQGVMLPLVRPLFYAHETEMDFWNELDADLGAQKWGRQLGIPAKACELMRDLRAVQAFNTSARKYWFTPQLYGIDASFAATMAAHREIRATTMLVRDNRKMPDPATLYLWCAGHDGEKLFVQEPDVLNLRRSFIRLAEKLESTGASYAEDLQALAHLDQHHEFLQPLAQQITRITVEAARSLCPGLVT